MGRLGRPFLYTLEQFGGESRLMKPMGLILMTGLRLGSVRTCFSCSPYSITTGAQIAASKIRTSTFAICLFDLNTLVYLALYGRSRTCSKRVGIEFSALQTEATIWSLLLEQSIQPCRPVSSSESCSIERLLDSHSISAAAHHESRLPGLDRLEIHLERLFS